MFCAKKTRRANDFIMQTKQNKSEPSKTSSSSYDERPPHSEFRNGNQNQT